MMILMVTPVGHVVQVHECATMVACMPCTYVCQVRMHNSYVMHESCHRLLLTRTPLVLPSVFIAWYTCAIPAQLASRCWGWFLHAYWG
jgi:hypothetical protein